MKTLNEYLATSLLILLVAISTMILYGQKNNEGELLLFHTNTISVDGNASFKKMVSRIVTKSDFKYRKALRRAKASEKKYFFSGKEISEVVILKHFKKAARESNSVEEFKKYFYDRELSFINVLSEKTVNNLYATIRATTFNGYLDYLDAFFG